MATRPGRYWQRSELLLFVYNKIYDARSQDGRGSGHA